MKVGDEVKIKKGEQYKDYSGRYMGTIGTLKYISEEYCEVVLYNGKVAMFPLEYLEPFNKTKNSGKCTCGAGSTSVPSYHYDWCDIHMKVFTPDDDFFLFNLPHTD